MSGLILTACLLFSCLGSLSEANSQHLARMIFTDKETTVKRLPLPEHHAPVRILLKEQPETVTATGPTHVYLHNFQYPQKPPVRKVSWKRNCIDSSPQRDCSYNITVVHEMKEANQTFVCGTNGRETLCCDMNLSAQPPTCIPSAKLRNIEEGINGFITKEGEPSVLVEESGDLYITSSGSNGDVGIHKFGMDPVGPANHYKEQHYVGLMLSRRRREDSLQDRVYAFYKEKNIDTGLQSDMWLPFVSQVCMADVGGPKSILQFRWTSLMKAKLFCGDPDSRQHFSELVDVATVQLHHWRDTRVYALFRNEWGMSAVCVYTIGDIHDVFMTSPFKDSSTVNQKDRTRTCVKDSTKISQGVLKVIENSSEMEQWVQPVNKSGPLLFNHHNYTHIYADGSQDKRNDDYTVLFLSLNKGGIHKVVQTKSKTSIIAEYRPFNHSAHILSIILQPTSKKLYVNTRNELVQVDVANCAKYGDSCEDCVLAKDPYCGWNGTRCAPKTQNTVQNVNTGDPTICPAQPEKAFRSSRVKRTKAVDSIALPSRSKYFLQCPVSSHHAQYTWRHVESSTPCRSKDDECLFLIDSMGPEQAGTYRCESEEMGYRKVRAEYQLQLKGRAASPSVSPLVWVCLTAALIKSLS